MFENFDLMVEERIAIIGPNGIGKTTLLKCLVGELQPERGIVKWSANAEIGYVAQDRTDDFADTPRCSRRRHWKQRNDDEQTLRAARRLLFSKEDSTGR